MNKVLIIAYHFPPIGGSGMQRTVKFVKYLGGFGWEPVILSVNKGTHYELIDTALMDEIPRGIKVYRTSWFNPFGLLKVPDKKIGWLPFAFFKGLGILRKEGISVIYSTSPTVTAHLIGYLLKKATKLPWVADFRDPWIGNPARSEIIRFRRRIEIFLEHEIIHNADRVVANTDLLKADFVRKYPDVDTDKFVTITNGYDPEDFENLEALIDTRKNGKFILTHTGEFYERIRNPENFLKAIGALLKEGLIEEKDLSINFVGSGEYVETERYKSLVREEGLQNIVKDVPYLPHRESIRYLFSSDALLLFTFSNGSLQVPAKTYEYIKSGKPILALAEEGSTSGLLTNIEIATIADPDDINAIKTALYEMYLKFKSNGLGHNGNDDSKEKFSRRFQTKVLATLFQELSKKAQTSMGISQTYSKLYRSIFFPIYESVIKRRKTVDYLKELENNQWLSEERLKEIQWLKLKKLLEHAYKNVPYYQNLLQANAIDPEKIRTPDDFRRIPFLTKDIIQKDRLVLEAESYHDKNICTNETGGSTGEPIKFAFPSESYQWRMASAIRANRWSGWDLSEKTTLIWGSSIDKKPFLDKMKVALHHYLMRRQYINAFYLSEEKLKECVDRINRFKPKYLESYVSSLYKIAKFINENKLECIKPKAIITSAETLYDYQRELIEKVFGCRVFNRYGCSETMLIAAECDKHAGMHLNIDNLYIEFLKDNKPVEAGEQGEIVLTDLNNYGMPFIRYKVGDIGVPSARRCGCGRGLPLAEKIEGRKMDVLLTAEGNFIQPQLFCFLFKEFDWIKQYQLVQEKKGALTFNILKRGRVDEQDKMYFLERVKKVINGNIKVNLEIVDEIPLTKSGKFRMVVSKVGADFRNNN